MATSYGTVKKTRLSAFSNPRKAGIISVSLEKGDHLIGTAISSGKHEILLATKQGKSLRFPEKNIREMGRSAKGVRGIKLGKDDIVVGMQVFPPDIFKTGATLLTVSSLGYAKRSNFEDYRVQSRGGKGIINLKTTAKNGLVVGILTVNNDDEIMAVTQEGMVVRCPVNDIRLCGRSTQGVKLISLGKTDHVMSVANAVSARGLTYGTWS
jgi:DNA gyrase subunit A